MNELSPQLAKIIREATEAAARKIHDEVMAMTLAPRNDESQNVARTEWDDTELLELAATAIGAKYLKHALGSMYLAYPPNWNGGPWDPINNERDAISLANKLQIPLTLDGLELSENPFAESRRRIVQAAAEIGAAIELSPEQIAAEERKAVVADILKIAADYAGIAGDSIELLAKSLAIRGYRKP